jgi:two-component system response regulator
MLLRQAFHRNGIMRPINLVEDGSQAIDYLLGEKIYADRVAHPFPNILLLDLKMPLVSGFEVLKWIQDHPDYRVIPTIVLTASADTRDVKHAFCLGANAYLCKPSSFQTFVEMVGRMLAFWEDCLKPGVEPTEPPCAELADRDPFFGSASK